MKLLPETLCFTCMWRYAALYTAVVKNPASHGNISVLEFFSLESSLKAISSDYGSNKERNVHLEMRNLKQNRAS